MKGDIKTVALVALGVFVAGLAMYYARDIDIVNKARNGFDA